MHSPSREQYVVERIYPNSVGMLEVSILLFKLLRTHRVWLERFGVGRMFMEGLPPQHVVPIMSEVVHGKEGT